MALVLTTSGLFAVGLLAMLSKVPRVGEVSPADTKGLPKGPAVMPPSAAEIPHPRRILAGSTVERSVARARHQAARHDFAQDFADQALKTIAEQLDAEGPSIRLGAQIILRGVGLGGPDSKNEPISPPTSKISSASLAHYARMYTDEHKL